MEIQRAIDLLSPGSKMPDFPHTTEEVDKACKMAVEALQEQQRRQGELEIVHCGECEKSKEIVNQRSGEITYCRFFEAPMNKTDYCNYGKRRESENKKTKT